MSIRLEVAVCLPEEHWHLCVSTLLLVCFFSLVLNPQFTLHTDLQMKKPALERMITMVCGWIT